MEVLVFKTSVSKKIQIDKISSLLESIPAIDKWNFDLEDCDNILRIVANKLSASQIEFVLHTAGFDCQELE